MAAPRLDALIGQIEKLSGGSCESPRTDRQLLDDFSARHDETAFAELVARHGPLVLRVCRRVLHHEQDAEDAFQATFLVLAQNLGSIRKREALADWLHGVAYRTAMKAKRTAARRRNHETQMRERTPSAAASPTWGDVQAVLDEEIQRLPAVYRSAFVLCVLEGKTIAAVAAELGCKDGTIATRVMRARQRLQKQLSRRGIQLAALLAALCVAESIGKAAVPGALARSVIRMALVVAAGGTVAGAIPPHVAALAAGVTRVMFLQKAKIAVVVLLTLGLFVAGAGVLTQQLLKAEEKPSVTQPAAKPLAEAAKPAEDTFEVKGRVLDPDGKPVAKARLYQQRLLKERLDNPADIDMVSLGVADEEGHFRIKLSRPSAQSELPFMLVAAADGFGLNWVESPTKAEQDEITLHLVKDQVVRGRLVNTEGKPVVGVTVNVLAAWAPLADMLKIYQQDDPREREKLKMPEGVFGALNKMVRVSATDKDGRFEIAGLGTERAVMVEVKNPMAVMPPFMIATREGFDPKVLKTPKLRHKEQWFSPSFECVVLPCRFLEGTVRAADSGKPIAGATVVAILSGAADIQAITDAKGHYQLMGLPKKDTYTLTITAGKMAPFLTRSVEVADRPGLETITCNVELSRGIIVTGRVLDKATGKGVSSEVSCVPLPDNPFAAKVADPNSRLEPVETDNEGRFSLVTIPGPGVLAAHVASTKIDGVRVNLYKQAEFDEADHKRVKVDEKERTFAIAGSRESLNNHNAVKVVDLKADAGPVAFNLTVDPGKTLTINLQDPDGRALAGVMASGFGALGRYAAPLKTAVCPVVALDPKQPRQLAFLHAERKLAALVTVRGDEKEPPTVRLAPMGTVTGRFLDSDGKPLAGAGIYAISEEGAVDSLTRHVYRFTPSWRTDKEGRFRLEGIPGMKLQFIVLKGGQETFVEETTTERERLKSGATLDLGDIRVKARSQ